MNRKLQGYLLSVITLLIFNLLDFSSLKFNKVFAESIRDQYNSYQKRSINNAQFYGTGEAQGYYIYIDDGGRVYGTKSGNDWEKYEKIRYGYITTYYEKSDDCQAMEALTLLSGNWVDHCAPDVPVKRETVVENDELVIYMQKGQGSPIRLVVGRRR